MGNIVSNSSPATASAGIHSYVSELSEFQYEKRYLEIDIFSGQSYEILLRIFTMSNHE